MQNRRARVKASAGPEVQRRKDFMAHLLKRGTLGMAALFAVVMAVGAGLVDGVGGVVGYFNPILIPIYIQHVVERPEMAQMIAHFAGVLNSVP
jgi:hypothetical protein